jgi:hypothetical protein
MGAIGRNCDGITQFAGWIGSFAAKTKPLRPIFISRHQHPAPVVPAIRPHIRVLPVFVMYIAPVRGRIDAASPFSG